MIFLMQVYFSLQKSLFNVKKYGAQVGDCEFWYNPSKFYSDITYYFWLSTFSNLSPTSWLMHNRINSFRIYFFSIWVFFFEHSRITGLQGKGEDISLTPHYRFHPLHRHLDISRAITAESSSLHIASSLTRTGTLSIPSAIR